MRAYMLLAIATALSTAHPALSQQSQQRGTSDVATIRHELERQYEANNRAMRAEDVAAVMSLRTDDFHSVSPDGTRRDRTDMEISRSLWCDSIWCAWRSAPTTKCTTWRRGLRSAKPGDQRRRGGSSIALTTFEIRNAWSTESPSSAA